MALPFNPELKVGQATYNNKEYLGIESLDNARRNGHPDLQEYLNSALIYAYGSNESFGERNFPILFQTQGMGKKRGVKSIDGLVRNFLLGKPKRTSQIAKTIHQPEGRTGIGRQEFSLIFRDRFFMKNQVIMIGGLASDRIQLQIAGDPVREGKGWRYRVRILGGDSKKYVPFKYLQAGVAWAGGVVAVSLEHSRGTESRSYYPYQTKNYLNLIRQSINVAGNVANKYLNFKFSTGGKTYELIYDWEKFLTEREWNAKRDLDLVMSEMTMDADGEIINVDSDSGKPVYRGAGLLQQIPPSNKLTYSIMTESLLENYITDILSITDQLDRDPGQSLVVDVLAGYGFLGEIDKALKRNVSLLTPYSLDSNHFVGKAKDGGLSAGAYFTEYKHRSGVIFRFTNYPAFDRGSLADSSERHPMHPNLPMTSFSAMILNFGLVQTGGGKTSGNIEYLYEEGREYIEGYTRGMAKIEGRQGGEISTDVDASSMHMMVSQGIHVNFPMSLGLITCKM